MFNTSICIKFMYVINILNLCHTLEKKLTAQSIFFKQLAQ